LKKYLFKQKMSYTYSTAQSIALSAPAQSIAYSAAPAQSIAYSLAPAQSIAVAAAPADNAALQQWADYSPENVELAFPELPPVDAKCYAPPQVPPGQTRFLKVDEPAQLKNLEQNFNDVRTAVRENNTHVQRNKTQITNVNRNHNHLLRIITNENNYEHNLTNKLVRVQDTHRQKIENVKGETRNFKDFKQTQKVEHGGCRRSDVAIVNAAPAQAITVQAAPAITVAAVQPAATIGQVRRSILAPSQPTQVRYLSGLEASASTLRSLRL